MSIFWQLDSATNYIYTNSLRDFDDSIVDGLKTDATSETVTQLDIVSWNIATLLWEDYF